MAHSLDAKLRIPVTANTTTTANPVTASFTCGAGCTVLVMGIIVGGTTARTGGSPTYNGVALTQAGVTRTSAETNVECWYLLDPPTGSSLTVSIPNAEGLSLDICVGSFKAQSGYKSVLDVATGGTGISISPSYSVTTTANGDAIFAIVGTGAQAWIPTARAGIQIYDNDNGSWGGGSQYVLQATAGARPMSWTFSTSDDWAIAIASFKEAAVQTTSLQVVWSIIEEKSVTTSWDVKNETTWADDGANVWQDDGENEWTNEPASIKDKSLSVSWKVVSEQSKASSWIIGAESSCQSSWKIPVEQSVLAGWKILAEHQNISEWLVYASPELQSSWLMMTEKPLQTSWGTLATVEVSASWHVGSGSEANIWQDDGENIWQDDGENVWQDEEIFGITVLSLSTSWKVVKELRLDSAWSEIATIDFALSWRNTTSASLNTGWAIGNQLTLSSSARVITDQGRSAAWLIATEQSKASSWAITKESQASSAWKMFNEAPLASGWGIVKEISLGVSWKTLAEQSAQAEWNILASSGQDLTWDILGITYASIASAWKVVTESGKDVSWSTLSQQSIPSSWAITAEKSIGSSWSVINAGQILIDLSWHIIAESSKQASWSVLKQTSAPSMSWAVLRDNSLNATWRILVEQSKSSGWGILREASGVALWAVFGAASTSCSWLVVNERTISSQWVILDNSKLSIPMSWAIMQGGSLECSWHDECDFSTSTKWNILKEVSTSPAWAILDTTKAISSIDWSILGTNSISQSWNILTQLAAPDTWRIYAQSAQPIAWGIINTTDLSRQLGWRILAQNESVIDWQVFNAARTHSSWGILAEDPHILSWRDLSEMSGNIEYHIAGGSTQPESSQDIDLASLLPVSIAHDPGMVAGAQGAGAQLTVNRDLIPQAVLYARIDELTSEALDHIAWGLHVEGWEFADTIERKRFFIRSFFDFHRYKGTAHGLRLHWRTFINREVLKIDPPGKSFLGVSMTQEERERFEVVHPEVRVYPFQHSGVKGSFFCGDCTGDPRNDYGVFPARTESLLRIGDRVTVYDPRLDEETEINRFEYDSEYVAQKATDTIEIRKPSNMSFGGVFLGRYLEGETVNTGASTRLFSLTLDRAYETELERRTPLSIQPSLTPFRTTYETETEAGVAIGIHLGNRYPDDYPETGGSHFGQHFPVASNASERIYKKLKLFDPDRVPGTMSTGRMTYLGAFRIGQQPPHTARVAVDMQSKRTPGAQFLSGYLRGRHLCKSDAETRIEQMRYVGKMAKRLSDKVLIAIHNRHEITTSSGLLTGTKRCGQIELEVI